MLILSAEFAAEIVRSLSDWCPVPLVSEQSIEETRFAALRHDGLQRLGRLVSSVVAEQGFVQIRGIPATESHKVFVTLATLVGKPFIDPALHDAIVGAHVRPDEALMGNQLRMLPLHTDYSMLLDPPRLTMSLCLEPDPMTGWGSLHFCDVEAMCFGLESDPVFRRFFSVSFPFGGRNARDEVDVIQSPIISCDSGKFLVRYHRSRIRQGFQALNAVATSEQTGTIIDFEQFTNSQIQTFCPEKGDITIIDNHRMLHARSRCSVVVNGAGTTIGRQMKFLFAH